MDSESRLEFIRSIYKCFTHGYNFENQDINYGTRYIDYETYIDEFPSSDDEFENKPQLKFIEEQRKNNMIKIDSLNRERKLKSKMIEGNICTGCIIS